MSLTFEEETGSSVVVQDLDELITDSITTELPQSLTEDFLSCKVVAVLVKKDVENRNYIKFLELSLDLAIQENQTITFDFFKLVYDLYSECAFVNVSSLKCPQFFAAKNLNKALNNPIADVSLLGAEFGYDTVYDFILD
eukprot:snap_masked-scaffold_17-processed-gene-4.18-mRNA-1 protein AED:1.00 eAED:1.00 QI:0/-1/0/0/-1/1/1/0/138